jgi:flagellar hook-associated protein 1 FlgK
MAVRSDIAADPQLITRGDVPYDATLVAGNIRIGTSDGSAAKRMADAFNQNQTFNLAGGLPQLTVTVASYAAQVLSLNASKASNAGTELEFGASLRQQLTARVASVSGVNMDEELANLILLENAYAATARIVTVTGEMFDALLAAV